MDATRRYELPFVIVEALRAAALPLLVSYGLVYLDADHLRVAAIHFHEVFHKVAFQPFLSLFWIELEGFAHLTIHAASVKLVKKVSQEIEKLFTAKFSEFPLADFAFLSCLPIKLLVEPRNYEISSLPFELWAPHWFGMVSDHLIVAARPIELRTFSQESRSF